MYKFVYPVEEVIGNFIDIPMPGPDGAWISKSEYYFRRALEMSEQLAKEEAEKEKSKPVVKEEQLEKAEKKFGDTPIANATSLDIMLMAGGNTTKEQEYLEKARSAKRLIEFTIFWLTDLNVTQLPVNFTKEEKEFVNAVANYVAEEFGKVFEDADTVNLNKYYTSSFYNPYNTASYLLTVDDIEMYLSNDFYDQMRAKWSKLNQTERPVFRPEPEQLKPQEPVNEAVTPYGRVGRFDESGYYHPAFTFTNGEQEDIPMQPEGMDDALFNKLELVFSNLVPQGKRHFYSYDPNGMLYLSTYSTTFDKINYMLDDGSIMGGSDIFICTNYINRFGQMDGIFVDAIAYPDIVRKILMVPMYYLNAEETQAVYQDMFYENFRIYRNIDLSNTGFFNKFTYDDKLEFVKSCGYAFQIMDQEGYPDVRLRITDYISPWQFKLVSDSECRSLVNEATREIIEGLIISINGSDVERVINGHGVHYSNGN